MKCKYCNSNLKEGDKFCRNCGAKIGEEKKEEHKEKVHEEVKPVENNTSTTTTPAPNKGQAIASIVLGAISLLFGLVLVPLPIIGLILGISYKHKCTEKTIGIVLNTISLVIVVLVYLCVFFFAYLFVDFVGDVVEDQSGNFDFTQEVEENDDNVIYDDELSEMLDNLRNWNSYSSLRSGNLGYNLDMNGGFRILDSGKEYWTFNNGTFNWYKDVDDLNDNYWYGTTNIVSGKEGFKLANISEDKFNEIIKRANGAVKEDNIYTVICTPTKIISGGVDKSSTNIPENAKWTYVWILVDHGTEGIEAQVFNADTSTTSYYVKIQD